MFKKSIVTYINEAKWEDWELAYYEYRKENGFKGSIEDLMSDENGFSSEMASDFYATYVEDKKGKSKARQYSAAMDKMVDKDAALKTSCVGKTVEEIAWLVASAIESAVPVEEEKHDIPFARGLQKTTYKVNFNGKDIYFHDKCYELAHNQKGYSSKGGFTVICGRDCKYKYDNRLACDLDTRKGYKERGMYRTWLWDDDTVAKLVSSIKKKVDKYYVD